MGLWEKRHQKSKIDDQNKEETKIASHYVKCFQNAYFNNYRCMSYWISLKMDE